MTSRLLVALLVLSSLLACTKEVRASNANAAPKGHLTNVDAQEFKTLAEQKNGTVLDVRTPGEVARGHLPNASVVDWRDEKFRQKAALMQKDKPVFVYCASGGRSASAAEALLELGFTDVYNLKGGIGAWQREGLPVDTSQAPANDAATMEPAALDALLASNRRVLVDYHTPWCAPCQRMSPIVDAVSEAWKGKALVVRVDIGASEALASRERIEGVPVFVLYVDAKERWRHSGELSRDALEAELAKP